MKSKAARETTKVFSAIPVERLGLLRRGTLVRGPWSGTQRDETQEDPDVMKTKGRRPKRYVLCLSNQGYPASLVVRRVYESVEDGEATKRGLLRVVDESGEDYLFPKELFAAVELPSAVRQRLAT